MEFHIICSRYQQLIYHHTELGAPVSFKKLWRRSCVLLTTTFECLHIFICIAWRFRSLRCKSGKSRVRVDSCRFLTQGRLVVALRRAGTHAVLA